MDYSKDAFSAQAIFNIPNESAGESFTYLDINMGSYFHKEKDIYDIMGDIDDMKLHSSMTLFALASEDGSVFHQVLNKFYNGEMDEFTLKLIK